VRHIVLWMKAKHPPYPTRRWEEFDAIDLPKLRAAFHQGLAGASGMRFLNQAVEQQNRLHRFSSDGWSRGVAQVLASAAGYLVILVALEQDDREAAAKIRHIQQATALIHQPLIIGS